MDTADEGNSDYDAIAIGSGLGGLTAAALYARTRDGGDRTVDHAPVLFGNAAPNVLADALPAARKAEFSQQFASREPSTSLWSMAVELDRPARDIGITHYSTMLLPDWFRRLDDYRDYGQLLAAMPGSRMPGIALVDYGAIDSGLNPAGTHLVSLAGIDRLSNWSHLDQASYAAKRDAWMDALIGRVDQAFPGFAAAVVHREMATAATMEHYLNTPGGAVYGFAQVPPRGIPTVGTPKGVQTCVPGLWLASTFGGFGGFTGSMFGGMLAARAATRSLARVDA